MSAFRINRVFSNRLTPFLLRTPITPNQVTFLSLGCGLLAGYFFSKGETMPAIIGALLYQLAMILDNCDGEVARAKNMRSEFGGWLDIFCDLLTDMALFIGVGFGAMHQGLPWPIPLLTALCVIGGVLHSILVVWEKLRGFGPAVFAAPHPDAKTRKSIFLDIFDAFREGDASWIIVGLAFFEQISILLWIGSVYMQILWVSALIVNFKWLTSRPRALK